jgi:hypothetical protein
MDPIDLSQLGFRARGNPPSEGSGWRAARFRDGTGRERSFTFPIGF